MIYPYCKIWPKIHETAFIAPSSDIIGDVKLDAHSSVWFQCVLRGDIHKITIGSKTNIQDHTTIHVTRNDHPVAIGDEVTIGHRCMIHGCTIEDLCLIGMGSILLDGCIIGRECIIGAGSLVTENKVIPPRSLVFGSPARVIRSLTEKELLFLRKSAQNYISYSRNYLGVIPGVAKYMGSNSDLELLSDPFDEGFSEGSRE